MTTGVAVAAQLMALPWKCKTGHFISTSLWCRFMWSLVSAFRVPNDSNAGMHRLHEITRFYLSRYLLSKAMLVLHDNAIYSDGRVIWRESASWTRFALFVCRWTDRIRHDIVSICIVSAYRSIFNWSCLIWSGRIDVESVRCSSEERSNCLVPLRRGRSNRKFQGFDEWDSELSDYLRSRLCGWLAS